VTQYLSRFVRICVQVHSNVKKNKRKERMEEWREEERKKKRKKERKRKIMPSKFACHNRINLKSVIEKSLVNLAHIWR
jgi:hypothetical protein